MLVKLWGVTRFVYSTHAYLSSDLPKFGRVWKWSIGLITLAGSAVPTLWPGGLVVCYVTEIEQWQFLPNFSQREKWIHFLPVSYFSQSLV
jgi:hypothetical protein